MPADLTNDQIEWALERHGAEAGIWLATIFGPENPDGLRLARNTEDVTSRGLLFTKSWFELELPSDTDDVPVSSITIPNVDRIPGLALIEGTGHLTVNFERVRPSDYDTVVESHRMLDFRAVIIKPLTVEAQLAATRLDQEPYGWQRVSPSAFPGLWRL